MSLIKFLEVNVKIKTDQFLKKKRILSNAFGYIDVIN